MKTQSKTMNVLKWMATFTMMTGNVLTGMAVFPAAPIVIILAGILWIVVSISWKEPSLIVTNAFGIICVLVGLYIGYVHF